MATHSSRQAGPAQSHAAGMSCTAYRIIRRREYRDDLDAIEVWIAQDNAGAAVAMWLLIDDQVNSWPIPIFRVDPVPACRGRMSLSRTRIMLCTLTRTTALAPSPFWLRCMWRGRCRRHCWGWWWVKNRKSVEKLTSAEGAPRREKLRFWT